MTHKNIENFKTTGLGRRYVYVYKTDLTSLKSLMILDAFRFMLAIVNMY